MFPGGRIGPALQFGGDVPLGQPPPLVIVLRLPFGQVRNRQRGHIPGGRCRQRGDAFLVHNVPVFHGVRPVLHRRLDRRRVGGVGHHRKLPLPADGESRRQLLGQQKRMPVPIPVRPHNAARQVQLDVIYPVLNLLPDGLHEPVGPVALPRLPGGQEMPPGGGQKVARCEHARAGDAAGVKNPLPGYIHKVGRAAAAHAGNPRLGERQRQLPPEVGRFLRCCRPRRHRIIRVNMHIPQTGQQIGAPQIQHALAGAARRGIAGADSGAAINGGNAPGVVYHHAGIGSYAGSNAINQVGIDQRQWHNQASPVAGCVAAIVPALLYQRTAPRQPASFPPIPSSERLSTNVRHQRSAASGSPAPD